MPRCSPLEPTPIATSGDHERSVPYGAGLRRERRAIRHCDPTPDRKTWIDPSTRRRGIDNFESFMRFLAPVGASRQTPAVHGGQRLFSPPRLRRVPHAGLVTGPSADRLFDRRWWRSSRISCSTISGQAMASRKPRPARTRFARHVVGVCAFVDRSSMRPRGHHRGSNSKSRRGSAVYATPVRDLAGRVGAGAVGISSVTLETTRSR